VRIAGAVRPGQVEVLEPFLDVIPALFPLFEIGAVRPQADEKMAGQFSDAELGGHDVGGIFFGIGHVRDSTRKSCPGVAREWGGRNIGPKTGAEDAPALFERKESFRREPGRPRPVGLFAWDRPSPHQMLPRHATVSESAVGTTASQDHFRKIYELTPFRPSYAGDPQPFSFSGAFYESVAFFASRLRARIFIHLDQRLFRWGIRPN